MARSLITPSKTSANSTNTVLWKSSNSGVKVTTNGAYIKTGGSSRIDPTRLLFWVQKNTSVRTTGYIYVVSGSTDGNSDYFPGGYSTLNNLKMLLQLPAAGIVGGISGRTKMQFFFLGDVAKYLDTDDYLKFNFSSKISSGTTAGRTTQGAKIGAIYLQKGAH
jgi:hypothetical protein